MIDIKTMQIRQIEEVFDFPAFFCLLAPDQLGCGRGDLQIEFVDRQEFTFSCR
jgi:hypothetical protein